jgi:hypothetical protein
MIDQSALSAASTGPSPPSTTSPQHCLAPVAVQVAIRGSLYLLLTTARLGGLAQSGNGALANVRLDQTRRNNP